MSKLIEQIAERLGASYIYDDFARINLRADSVEKFPLIVETLPVDGSLNMRFLPVVQAQKNVTIAFLEPCPLDFDGARVDTHLLHMLELATAFVRELAKGGGVYIPDDLDYNAVLDFMDANLVGVRITLALPETFTCQSVFDYTEPVATPFPFVKITREAWESECNNDIRNKYANEGVYVEWREGITHEDEN